MSEIKEVDLGNKIEMKLTLDKFLELLKQQCGQKCQISAIVRNPDLMTFQCLGYNFNSLKDFYFDVLGGLITVYLRIGENVDFEEYLATVVRHLRLMKDNVAPMKRQ